MSAGSVQAHGTEKVQHARGAMASPLPDYLLAS